MEQARNQYSQQRVLIWAPFGRDALVLRGVLDGAGLQCVICKDLQDARARLRQSADALLLTEEALATAGCVAMLAEEIEAQPPWSALPLVLLATGDETAQQRLGAALECLGFRRNVVILARPSEPLFITSALESVLRARQHQYVVRDLLDQLRGENENLEQRVGQRTAELEGTNVELEVQVAERLQAVKALQRSHAALRRSNREMQDFIYAASHDLQEPLRKVITFADMVLVDYGQQLEEAAHAYLQRMQAAAARMSGIVHDLLSFSRVSTQGKPFREVDLNDVLKEVLSDLKDDIAKTGARIIVEPLPSIEADGSQICQLFKNLIGNALRFHRPDATPAIRVSSTPVKGPGLPGSEEPPTFQFAVQDHGIGFDEKYLDRIFSPFQRLNGRSAFDGNGNGIGLAICQRIVERHAGTITATSIPGEGSTFYVTLPAEQSPDEAAQEGRAEERMRGR